MADRHPPRGGATTTTDAPLVDLIFPNRGGPNPGTSGNRRVTTDNQKVQRVIRQLRHAAHGTGNGVDG